MMQQAARQGEKGVLCQGRLSFSFSFIFSFSFFFGFNFLELIRCELGLIKYPVIYEGKNG